MKLLALIFAYAISHFVAKPHRFRLFSWFRSWYQWLLKSSVFKSKELNLIIIIAVPVAVIASILLNLYSSIYGGLLIAIVVLSFCIGPESLEEDVESGELRKRIGIADDAGIATLIKKMTQVSLKRWFGVFFWYVVLGIVGALIYRLSERLDQYLDEADEMQATVAKLIKILNYPVAWMMVMSLAIASDFERIYKKCKPFFNVNNIKTLDDSFLYEATDFAVENCEAEAEDDLSIEQVAMKVLKRMLVVWLVFVAILVILEV